MDDTVIEVEGLRKAYGDHLAVEDVSFEVRRGEIFGILGPNGAGKTTTVECLQGLRDRDGGRVLVLGLDPATHADRLRRRIGSQLQESALPDRMKVREALDLFASVSSPGADLQGHLREWGLEEQAGASFGALSGGQQQRLFVALALLGAPEVVFLDELTQGLDPAARRTTWDLVRAIRDRGTTVVMVTHFMEEAQALCDRLAVVADRRVAAIGTPTELVERAGGSVRVSFSANGEDLDFLADVPHVHAVERNGRRVTISGAGPCVPLVAAELVARGIVPPDLRTEDPGLEGAYLALTGATEE